VPLTEDYASTLELCLLDSVVRTESDVFNSHIIVRISLRSPFVSVQEVGEGLVTGLMAEVSEFEF
jgi:hypothetical protein